MDLVTSCPFRSLLMVFLAVPIGVVVAICAADVAAGLKRHGWRERHR